METVPDALEDAVLTAVERVATRNEIELNGSEESVNAIEFAVEEALAPVEQYLTWAEEAHHYARVAHKEGRIYAAISGELFVDPSHEQDDEAVIEALLVYQLDSLIGAHELKNHEKTLHLAADIFELQRLIGEREKRQEIRNQATARAKIRHKDMNEKKAAVLEEWIENGHEYESRADFSRIIGALKGIKYRTLYEWIAEYEKSEYEKD
jgi:hypothetical protein